MPCLIHCSAQYCDRTHYTNKKCLFSTHSERSIFYLAQGRFGKAIFGTLLAVSLSLSLSRTRARAHTHTHTHTELLQHLHLRSQRTQRLEHFAFNCYLLHVSAISGHHQVDSRHNILEKECRGESS